MGEGPAKGWGLGVVRRAPRAPAPRSAAPEPWPAGSQALGQPPGSGRREARTVRAPAAPRAWAPAWLPPDSPSPSEARLALDPHPAWEKCFFSRWAVVSKKLVVIISQNGTEKLRVGSFFSLCTVQKNLVCVSPFTE